MHPNTCLCISAFKCTYGNTNNLYNLSSHMICSYAINSYINCLPKRVLIFHKKTGPNAHVEFFWLKTLKSICNLKENKRIQFFFSQEKNTTYIYKYKIEEHGKLDCQI